MQQPHIWLHYLVALKRPLGFEGKKSLDLLHAVLVRSPAELAQPWGPCVIRTDNETEGAKTVSW